MDSGTKMSELVAEKLRIRIANGGLAAGDPLPSETVLLQQYGVARPTMREALRILESEGLLVVKRGKGGGPRVAVPRVDSVARQAGFLLQVSGTRLTDVLRARTAIETPAITDIDALTGEKVLAALTANVAAARDLVGDGDAIIERGTALHDEFHRMIVAAGGGETLALFHAVLEQIIDRASRNFVMGGAARRTRLYRAAVDDHAAILDALQRGDGSAAAKRWHEHLMDVEGVMLRSSGATRVVDLF